MMEKIKISFSPSEQKVVMAALERGAEAPFSSFPSAHDAMMFKSACEELMPRVRRVKKSCSLPYFLVVVLEKALLKYSRIESEGIGLLQKVQPHLLPLPKAQRTA
jgi:hypothetical protein